MSVFANATDVLLGPRTAQTSGTTLVFGHIDGNGSVYLEPGDYRIYPPPPSLVPLAPDSRFAAITQGVKGGAQTLLIVGLVDGGDGNPTGVTLPFAGRYAPEGYLLCDGRAVRRDVYSRLFGVIGTIYGSGDGMWTFNIPDYRGRVPVGFSPGEAEFATLGQRGGAKRHTLTVGEIPSHDHELRSGWGGGSLGSSWFRVDANSPGNPWGRTGSTGGGQSHNNLQPYIAANYIIRI